LPGPILSMFARLVSVVRRFQQGNDTASPHRATNRVNLEDGMASKILEISEHSEIISEFSENLVHRGGVMYPRGHGPFVSPAEHSEEAFSRTH
jgi:hypothetical protein